MSAFALTLETEPIWHSGRDADDATQAFAPLIFWEENCPAQLSLENPDISFSWPKRFMRRPDSIQPEICFCDHHTLRSAFDGGYEPLVLMLAAAANGSVYDLRWMIVGSCKPPFMDNGSLVPSNAARVASLGGFLNGISYLNQDRHSDFAEAFVVEASDDRQFPEYIQTSFSHLTGLTVRLDGSFQETMGQLEQDLKSLLLVNPFVGDEHVAQNMRSYLSFKIMDRLDDIINDWERLDDDTVLLQ
ncbi:MAG: hypothetical protein AAFV54_07820, partial [Pseudomonadota bacterium]